MQLRCKKQQCAVEFGVNQQWTISLIWTSASLICELKRMEADSHSHRCFSFIHSSVHDVSAHHQINGTFDDGKHYEK